MRLAVVCDAARVCLGAQHVRVLLLRVGEKAELAVAHTTHKADTRAVSMKSGGLLAAGLVPQAQGGGGGRGAAREPGEAEGAREDDGEPRERAVESHESPQNSALKN